MAQVARSFLKNEKEDQLEQEQAARSRMKAEEKEKLKAAEAAKKLEADNVTAKPAWGSRGVHALVDDEYVESTSPVVPRRAEGETPAAIAYPVSPASEATARRRRASSHEVYSGNVSAWAPPGMDGGASISSKDIIKRALDGLDKAQPASPAKTPSSTEVPKAATDGTTVSALETALKLLGSQLEAERARSARLETQLNEVTAKLLESQEEAIERLERENERLSRA